ncbi:MAG: CDP-alcohol phosphatidyltransferase family protein [Acidobacteriia bacterium]|jgi:CDP-diacylglycerol--glycerol-3-phosphate 3-phosphatidyltransferase|nr:CDP-alcohol phosphatidyltransferase family protein [Terriglobia bacterium]
MLSKIIGKICTAILDTLVKGISKLGVGPNLLTFFGFLITILSAFYLAQGNFFYAGIVIIFSGIFDMLDGRLARITNNVTRFGAFFDSVLDRYSDMILFLALMIYYIKNQQMIYVLLSGIVMIGAIMTSYTRARAESLVPTCKVGFLERPERLVLLIIGTIFGRMAAVLWVMAVLSNLTVVHRILHTWKESSKNNNP